MTTATTRTSLSPYLVEKPQDLSSKHACCARLYCVAAIISGIAATTILGTLTALYLGVVSILSVSSGWVFAGSLVGLCASMHGVSKFSEWRKWERFEVEILERVVQKLQRIESWTEANVKWFFAHEGLDFQKYSDEHRKLLAARKPDAPLKALLPLIARYLVMADISRESQAVIDKQDQAIAQLGNEKAWIKRHNDVKVEHGKRLGQSRAVAAFYLQCLTDPNYPTPPTLRKVFQMINACKPHDYSIPDLLWNVLFYRNRTPAVGNILTQRNATPREIRRLLFA